MSDQGYLGILRAHPNFRRLWLGDVVSFLGDWFNVIALYTAVDELASSALAVTAVILVKTLPSFAITPFSGPIVDRFDRRRILLWCNLLRALLGAGLVGAYLLGGRAGLSLLYALTALMVLCTGVAYPAKTASLPMVVPREGVSVANALLSGTWSVMLALGAGLGGLATGLFGVTASLAIDAATFVVAAAIVFRLPALEPPPAEEGDSKSFVDGLRYLRRAPYVQGLACLKMMMAFANGMISLLPLWGTLVFAATSGPEYTGYLYMMRGVGAAFGSLAVRKLVGDRPWALRVSLVVGFLLAGGFMVVMSYAPNVWMAGLAILASAVGAAIVWVFTGTLLQIEADSRFHGRVFAFEFGTMTLVLGAMSLWSGWTVDSGLSVPETTRLFGLLAVPPALFWTAVLVGKWRRESAAGSGGTSPRPAPQPG